MNWYFWSLIGFVLGVCAIFLYMIVSPAYRRGQRFSLPLLPFAGIVALHLFIWFTPILWFCVFLDSAQLLYAIIARIRRK